MNALLDPTVAWLTVRQLFVRRRLIAAVTFALAPVLIAALYRATNGGGDADSARFFATLCQEIVISTLLPLTAVVLGTTSFGGEIDDGTVVYLLVKPLPRWRLVLTKYLVAVAATAAVMLPAIPLAWLVLGTGSVPADVPLAFAAATVLGATLYNALFLTLGLVSRRALVLGLLYIVVLEFVLSRDIAGIKSLSIREFARTVVGQMADGQVGITAGAVSSATVWTMGAIILAGSLGLAIRRLNRYEMAERL
jgi:ABC-2 type transport system permease protein